MAKGLPRKPFQLFVSGGIDTKTDPRLVPAGELLEVENMFYQRTGELRLRNGFATLSNGGVNAALMTEINGLFPDVGGAITAVGKSVVTGATNHLSMQRYANLRDSIGWASTGQYDNAYPGVTCERITGTGGETASTSGIATGPPNSADGSVASSGTFDLHTWIDSNLPAAGVQHYQRRDGGVPFDIASFGSVSSLPPLPCAVATGGLAIFAQDGTGGVTFAVWSATGTFLSSGTILAGLLDTAGWFDVQAVPATANIVIAYKRPGGAGSAIAVFSASSFTIITGPTNIAAADATQAICLLEDAAATGSAFMVTAGTTSGVVCRTITIATLATTATNIIDATATANVKQLAGHTNGAATNYFVFWSIFNVSPLYYSFTQRGNCVAGVTTIVKWMPGLSIYSRTFKGKDGRYYILGAYESATQPMYLLFLADVFFPPVCVVFPGVGTGRRTTQSHVTAAYLDSQGRSILSAGRKSSLSTSSQERIAFTFGARTIARELGGALYTSGGVLMSHDKTETRWATTIMYPEPIAAAASGTPGGLQSSKTYSWVAVIAENDALGNRTRSAKSVPTARTLAAGETSAALTLQNPRTPPRPNRNQTVEIYRAGPAEDGAVNYNKIGELYSNPVSGGDTLAFLDTVTDAVALTGEALYSTGNVLENFVTPSTKLLEVANSRLWMASAETTDELWPSKTFTPGKGVNFNPLLAFRVTGDGYGAITALAAMDGRLIVFKSSAIYPIAGDGPNDLGQGSFNKPVACTLSIGTTNPASVCATPDGVLFQSPKGQMWLLDRGLGTAPTGASVEQYTLAENIVASSLVTGATQARFVTPTGRCLVYDWLQKKWTTYALRVQGSTVVACADIPGGWCYACADGRVYQETAGVYSDINSVSTIAIIPIVTFPEIAVAGINGFARLSEVSIVGEWVGNHTLIATLSSDYDLALSTPQQFSVTNNAFQYAVKPAQQKGTAFRLRLTSTHAAGSGAFRLTAATLWAALKVGSSVPYTKRLV